MIGLNLNRICQIALLTCVCCVVRAEISLPPQFSDGMVLQRGARNRIWGGRTANESVWYEYSAGDGKKIVDRASARGKDIWEFTIDVPEAMGRTGNDASLVIWEGKKSAPSSSVRTIKNIAFGDVWIVAIPRGEGMTLPAPALGLRVLQLPEASGLNQFDNGTKWTATPARLQTLTIKLAETLAGSLDRKGVPLGIIETSSADLEEWIRNGTRIHHNPAFANMTKFARIDANKHLDATNSIIRQTLVEMKHRGAVPKFHDNLAEIESERGVVMAPLQFNYNRYVEYEPVLHEDFRTDVGIAHWITFQAILQPPLAKTK